MSRQTPRGAAELVAHGDLVGPQYDAEHDHSQEGLDAAAYRALWAEIPDAEDYLPNGTRRCRANARNEEALAGWPSDRRRCRKTATPGSPVCGIHGSKNPAAARKARLRLHELVDPAVAQLARILADPATKASDRLRAIENILDRAGHPRRTQVDVDEARALLPERLAAIMDKIRDDNDDNVIEAEILDASEDAA